MTPARYDAVADFYVSGFDSTDDQVSAALLDLLGPVAGLRVLDVACGHGRLTRELARRGQRSWADRKPVFLVARSLKMTP